MPSTSGTASDHRDLLDRLRRYATGYGTVTAGPSFTGTGDGQLAGLDTAPGTVTETWTIECTDAGTEGAELWSVTGSVSGAQAAATTGQAYANDHLAFRIEAGGTTFAVGDRWTLELAIGDLAAAGQAWDERRWQESGGERELVLHGPGSSADDNVYVGLRTYADADADYFNWAFRGYLGFIETDPFDQQPGVSPEKAMPLWDQPIPYWLVVSGRRIIVAARISTVYQLCYLGLLLPFATPAQFPYPLLVGGTLDSASATRWSATGDGHRFFPKAVNLALRFIEGTWMGGNDLQAWPYSRDGELRENFSGEYPLFPILYSDNTPNVYGELDGLYFVPGFANAAENTIEIGGVTYLVLQDTFRTGNNDYCALELA